MLAGLSDDDETRAPREGIYSTGKLEPEAKNTPKAVGRNCKFLIFLLVFCVRLGVPLLELNFHQTHLKRRDLVTSCLGVGHHLQKVTWGHKWCGEDGLLHCQPTTRCQDLIADALPAQFATYGVAALP